MDKQVYMFELIEQWKISGKSKKAFCHNHGIGTHKFYYWCKKWKENQSENPAGFIAITPDRTNSFHAQYRLSYPNGVQLEVSGVSLDQLAALVKL